MRYTQPIIVLIILSVLAACQRQEVSPNPSPDDAYVGQGILDPQKGPAHTGYILGNDDKTPVKIQYQVVDGIAVFDGDMGIGPAAAVARTPEELLNSEPSLSSQAFAHTGSSYWPDGEVPVIKDATPTNLQAAFDQIEAQVPGINFVDYDGQGRSLTITYSSDSGYLTDCQPSTNCIVYIGSSGASKAILMHELGHALGFVHEHQRCDRDEHLIMQPAGNANDQFDKLCTYGEPLGNYDITSIMHYNSSEFDPDVLYFTDLNGDPVQGYRDRPNLSEGDVTAWQSLYPSDDDGGDDTVPGTTVNTADYTGPYNLRSGPGTSYDVVGSISGGQSVSIVCQTSGTTHTGPYGETNLWDKLSTEEWISDAFVYTGSNGTVAPPCN